jgi:FMN phosphatase YigB (HAD superfamily)
MHLNLPSDVDAFIFDLGEVIVHLDEDTTLAMFAEYAAYPKEEIKEKLISHPALYQYEVGALTDREFVDAICQDLKMTIDIHEFQRIWNSLIVHIPSLNLQLLATLKDSYHTLVLSNTNSMHVQRFESIVQEMSGGGALSDFVHFTYYSHELGLRKPSIESFEYLISEHGLIPERTIFFDDKIENIEASTRLGIKSIHVSNYKVLYDFFDISNDLSKE